MKRLFPKALRPEESSDRRVAGNGGGRQHLLLLIAGLLVLVAILVLVLGRGGGGPEDAARRFLAAVDGGRYDEAIELEANPLRARGSEEQRTVWEAWKSGLEKLAAVAGGEYVSLTRSRLEVTAQTGDRAELAVYWNDAVVKLVMRCGEKRWRVAELELKPAPGLAKKVALAVMSRHGAIPVWLDGLDRYWNSEGRWSVNAAGWIDPSWQDAYKRVEDDLMRHFHTPFKIITAAFDLPGSDPELYARVEEFQKMVEQVYEEVRAGANAMEPNLPWVRGHVPKAKEIYKAWRDGNAADLPGFEPEEVNAVLDAGFRLLYQAGEWPPTERKFEEYLAEAKW